MGAGSLVASAVAIILIVVAAYAVIGSTLVTAEVVATAQSDQIHQQEARLHTSIAIVGHTFDTGASTLYLNVENTGSEPILAFDQMVIFTLINGSTPVYYSYDDAGGGGTGTWSWVSIEPDTVHPRELDPDEVINISVRYADAGPAWAQVTTPNGVYDSAYLR
ncbi:MAG: archaeal flagellar protein FlaF [Methanofollis sp.]|nr:archaeal flagellar protein FlaF [Methanofollis sp.]